jgi:hypothetical protein
MNSKGTAQNIFLFVIGGFIFATLALVGWYVVNSQVMPQLQPLIGTDPVVNETLNTYSESLDSLDYAMFAIFFGFMAGAIVAALLVRTHPIFFFIYLLLIVMAIVISVPLSNNWQTMETQLSMTGNLSITSFIMGNLPILTAVLGVIAMVISFIKMSSGGAREL